MHSLWLCTYSDGHCHADKQHEDWEINFDHARLVLELVVQPNCNGTSQTERDGHTDYTNIEGYFPVAEQEPQVDFEADDEEEQGETEVRNQVQVGP